MTENTRPPAQCSLEELADIADEIAHDLIEPPDDDATDEEIERTLELVDAASQAVLDALRGGADLATARAAAIKVINDWPVVVTKGRKESEP